MLIFLKRSAVIAHHEKFIQFIFSPIRLHAILHNGTVCRLLYFAQSSLASFFNDSIGLAQLHFGVICHSSKNSSSAFTASQSSGPDFQGCHFKSFLSFIAASLSQLYSKGE